MREYMAEHRSDHYASALTEPTDNQMPKFAANLHYLFTELPFLQRFEAAADVGFEAVEFTVAYDYPETELSACLKGNKLQMVLIDAPMGDWARGDRGLAAVPGRESEFRA